MNDQNHRTPEQKTQDQISIRSLAQEMHKLNTKMDQIFDLVETIIIENAPCNQKKRADESIDEILKLIEESPMAKHPVFADMMKPLKDIMKSQKA